MLLGGLDTLVTDSFLELRSDHDVMFVLEHQQVWETDWGRTLALEGVLQQTEGTVYGVEVESLRMSSPPSTQTPETW